MTLKELLKDYRVTYIDTEDNTEELSHVSDEDKFVRIFLEYSQISFYGYVYSREYDLFEPVVIKNYQINDRGEIDE
jgi:hypothetical protein